MNPEFITMRIIFFGTPVFAAAHLEYLVQNGHEIAAVVTAPDKPAGRGKQLQESAVKKTAMQSGIPVLQPLKLKDPEFVQQLQIPQADLFIVIAFRMLPEIVWKLPVKGTFNLHASLLPNYRGAAPINRAIMNGETETGLTTFLINEDIDTGHIIKQIKLPIGENETAGELHDKMIQEGCTLVEETILLLSQTGTSAVPQSAFVSDFDALKPAPKLYKEDGKINWNKNGREIHNLIRGLSPYPGSYTRFVSENGELMELKLYKSRFEETAHDKTHFTLLTDNRTYAKVALEGGFLFLDELQQSGKKNLPIEAFLNGFKFHGIWKADLMF